MDTAELAVFVLAAETGSLSAAGRRLGLSPMLASRRLASLEAELGVRLMHRTTRSISPTTDGETFLPHARTIVEADARARASLAPVGEVASGLLRITAPAEFGRLFVAPLLPGLLARHPLLRVDLQLTDSIVDIVSSGIDVAVRIAQLRDSSLVARKLAVNPVVLCAAPAYLAAAGTPDSVAAIAHHECLILNGSDVWHFRRGSAVNQVRVTGRLSTNSIEAVREACAAGLGLALLSKWKVRSELEHGTLREIVFKDGMSPGDLPVWALYPSANLAPLKLRVCLDTLTTSLKMSSPAEE